MPKGISLKGVCCAALPCAPGYGATHLPSSGELRALKMPHLGFSEAVGLGYDDRTNSGDDGQCDIIDSTSE